jgi:predicted TPR repeat methyltransferase
MTHGAHDYAALLALYQRGALDEAERGCVALLALEPAHAGALQLQGLLHARRGEFDAALASFDRAIAAAPELASAYNHRGHVLLALEQPARAVASYDQAIARRLEDPHALNNRGIALQAQTRWPEALASYERAAALAPGLAEAHLNRGELLIELGEREAAIEALRRAAEAGADAAKVQFALASLGAEAPAQAAPPEFVRELFDQYAPHFDSHLGERLGYRAPQLIADAVAALALPAPVELVDLGCGTGLCGPLLRPHARRLEGVDLSPAMLEQARRLALYDELVCAELVEHLGRRPGAFELAVAADVLIYFGDLAPVFAAVHRALRPQGAFVFTLEATEAVPFLLRPSRRFAHARAYVEATARAQGFDLRRVDSVVLRTEGRVDVGGHLVVLQRGP